MKKTTILTNGRGEKITVTLDIKKRKVAPKRNEIAITAESTVPVELECGTRAVYENGQPVNNWKNEGQEIVCTPGDIKRLGTYPIFVYANGDKTKKGRFQIRNIEGIDRFRINKIAS